MLESFVNSIQITLDVLIAQCCSRTDVVHLDSVPGDNMELRTLLVQ